jgi:hypothetical protein
MKMLVGGAFTSTKGEEPHFQFEALTPSGGKAIENIALMTNAMLQIGIEQNLQFPIQVKKQGPPTNKGMLEFFRWSIKNTEKVPYSTVLELKALQEKLLQNQIPRKQFLDATLKSIAYFQEVRKCDASDNNY